MVMAAYFILFFLISLFFLRSNLFYSLYSTIVAAVSSSSSSSISSSSSSQPKKYDVFISFRGADIRKGFLCHLHKALTEEGLETFVDDNLERGEDITSSLLQAIEQSYISLVIFSENYARSPWCLDELVKISDCMEKMEQIFLPIFYEVNSDHVQELTGSFRDAIVKHRKDPKFSSSKVDTWCRVLKQIAVLSGEDSRNFKSDSNLIKEILNHILKKLDSVFQSDSSNGELVGIDSRVNCVESLLSLDSVDVRIIGIWGMGGIGKTTIAKEVFDKIRHQFSTQCFVASIREMSESRTLDSLQSEILCKLLGTENSSNTASSILLSPFNRKRLARKKVLVVLDDVSDLDQVELLIGKQVNYGPWSRIIMTSRDKQLLKNGGAEIYEVEGLDRCESLWLFCLHAFKKRTPEEGYETLSIDAVRYAQGLPLALKVLGSSLYGKSVEEWEDELKMLTDTSDDQIQKILRISYNGLCANDKDLFLDIACFLEGEDKDHVERISGVGSKIGISRLVDKSLISISNDKKLNMHDLIQQMGKDIVNKEKQPGRRSRLWHDKDICHVLTKKKGTEAIEGMSLAMFLINDVQLCPEAFEGMENLRFLKFYDRTFGHLPAKNKVHLRKGLKCLPDTLRFLQWDGYPLKSLPNSLCAENLVEIHMCSSKLKELWDGVQHIENLKIIDLKDSKKLVRIPDLSRALNLEELCLSRCRRLIELPSSLKYLSKLTKVDLSCCSRLHCMPGCLHSAGLITLDLGCCSKIRELPKIPCYKSHSRNIENVSSAFQLSYLKLNECSVIQHLPDNICNLGYLRDLNIGNCVNIHRLPENLGNLSSLKRLKASGSGIKELPDSICNLKCLEELHVSYCKSLGGLPEKMQNLTSLRKLNASYSGIKYLPQLPLSLEELKVKDCPSLISAFGSFQLVKEQLRVRQFMFINCLSLGEEERSKMMEHALERPWIKSNEKYANNLQLCFPGSEIVEKMKYRNNTGYSLSLSLSQLDRWSDIEALYFCAVFDPSLYVDPILIEYTGSYNVKFSAIGRQINIGPNHKSSTMGVDYDFVNSKHVLLWREKFRLDQVEPLPDPLVVSFYAERNDGNQRTRCYAAITACGVHPAFYDGM